MLMGHQAGFEKLQPIPFLTNANTHALPMPSAIIRMHVLHSETVLIVVKRQTVCGHSTVM